MTTDDKPFARAAEATLRHYERNAESFWEGTRDHDVTQNRQALLRHLEGQPPLSILDLGCGPGRDLMAFTALGHVAIGLDGSPSFCAMARAHSGCEVWQQDFFSLSLPAARFDGVFANASLFHLPAALLPAALTTLRNTLKPRGVLFASNPRGGGEEGYNGERYACYHDESSWCAFVRAAGFDELERYYRPPGLPRAQQPWFATVWRRRG